MRRPGRSLQVFQHPLALICGPDDGATGHTATLGFRHNLPIPGEKPSPWDGMFAAPDTPEQTSYLLRDPSGSSIPRPNDPPTPALQPASAYALRFPACPNLRTTRTDPDLHLPCGPRQCSDRNRHYSGTRTKCRKRHLPIQGARDHHRRNSTLD